MVPTENGTLYRCTAIGRRGANITLAVEGDDGEGQSLATHRTSTVTVIRPAGCDACPMKEQPARIETFIVPKETA